MNWLVSKILCLRSWLKNTAILTVYADTKKISNKGFEEAASQISSITKSLSSTLHGVAYLLLVVGLGMLILSFKSEDANSKDKGIMALCVAAVLLGIDAFIF